MRKARWYVIQVQTGREESICRKILRACRVASCELQDGTVVLRECFSPRYAYQHKRDGEWVNETMPLLPGYVIAVTEDPWTLVKVLRGMPEFTRLLTMGKTVTPLDEQEKSWLERWTKEGDRTIPMSIAYKEGDMIVITDGPLVGQEALITRVNRRKSVAQLEIHAGQMTIHTTVGLAVLPKAEQVSVLTEERAEF